MIKCPELWNNKPFIGFQIKEYSRANRRPRIVRKQDTPVRDPRIAEFDCFISDNVVSDHGTSPRSDNR